MTQKHRLTTASRLWLLTAVIALYVYFPTNSLAQSGCTLQGFVVDAHGARITGADVLLTSRERAHFFTTTDTNGFFEFTNLTPGEYVLEISAKGFSLFTADPIHLTRGKTGLMHYELKPAAINESVVVTATGTAQRVDEVAKAVTLVRAEEIENRHELSLAEALRGTPGVRVQQQGSPGALTTVRLRGLRNFDTAVLLDGLRVRDASDINGSAVPLITDLAPVAIDRVEILRGSGSTIYGTNAIGGVINLVPLRGTTPHHFEIGFEGGQLALFRERLQFSGGSTRLGYTLGLNRLDVRHGVDGDDQYGNSVFAIRLQSNFTRSLNVSGGLYGTIGNARLNDSPFALPAAFTAVDSIPRAAVHVTFEPDFNNPDQGRRHRLLIGTVRLTQQINDYFNYTFAYQRVASNRRNYNGERIDPRFASFYPFGDFAFLNVNRGTTDTVDGRVNIRLGRSNLTTGGIEYEHESFFQESIPSFNLFNKTTDKQRTFAGFVQHQLSMLADRLQISAGLRVQSYRIRAADRPGFLAAVNAESSVTAEGAVAYYIPSIGTKLRGHVGNGFRAPSLFERFGAGTFVGRLARFGDPTLRAEQSIAVDAGFDQRLAGDRLAFGATYFYTRLQRVIGFTSFATDPLGVGRSSGYVNNPGGLARGLETYVEASVRRGTQIVASYTYTNSDRSTGSGSLRPEFVIPAHVFGVTFTQTYRSFVFNVDLNRTGSYIAPIFENSFPFRQADLAFSGYTKMDLFGSYEFHVSQRVVAKLFAGADNILNRTYFENGFLAPGIASRAGINFRF